MLDGYDTQTAAHMVAQAQFGDGQWPTFFTCVRWYLGQAAEDQLVQCGYVG
jgi:hypothetical protein